MEIETYNVWMPVAAGQEVQEQRGGGVLRARWVPFRETHPEMLQGLIIS